MLQAFDHNYFKALLILMPGFLTQRIYAYFATTTKASDFEVIASALAFSIVNFAIAVAIWRIFGGDLGAAGIPGHFIALLLGVTVATGLAWVWVDSSGIVYRWAPVTSRVSNTSPWATSLRENVVRWKAMVRVQVKDGDVYHGWPYYFSEDGEGKNQLFLKPAFLEDQTGCPRVKGPGVFLIEDQIKTIEFLDVVDPKKYECQPRSKADKEPAKVCASAPRARTTPQTLRPCP
jgi:hypothetical protein